MEDAGIYARESPTLDSVVQLGVVGGRVINVSFPDSVPEDAEPDHPILDRIFDYLGGAEDHFDDAPVALTVPTDQRSVLEATRNVPHGETISVERLARLAGLDADDEEDVRLVEKALRENPVPLLIPDHRIEATGATPEDVAAALRRVEQG
ncbi:MGMT family protein [Haloprofundus sp. MHR1]|uniref:MGMT family protein n=1 Tax=Haloprofundus sp. MHR1 TaxID=2572921 RepID=UPI0010BF13D9|nr:MGMT family protein [Haloprofundus sp. MHR1]QCJ47534.1 methylated-DNA--[protein]-cysteine S-methyltransferase [Haloprofundus sp. MHR1]